MDQFASDLRSDFLEEPKKTVGDSKKFGTFFGVFVPSILMLFGVIIFLRLGWIVGLGGLSSTLIIISLATCIALITILSMSAISTNIEVKAGGMYYILSRSLGIEVGSAVGLPLFLKQSLTIAFCVMGFAESLKDLIPSWNITYIGLGTLAALTFLAYTSVRSAMKVQMGIFIAIITALISLFLGGTIEPVEASVSSPIKPLSFWAIFAIFFPAMTGLESSVSLSGDLRHPSKSLPLGTISAIVVGFITYAAIAIFLSYRVCVERLVQDPLIIQNLALIPSLIVVGIWGATLSSALGGLLGAPRTLKAIADDGIAPKIFSKTFGPMEEPRLATLLACAIAFLGVCFGSVNVIAPLLTMISLICYGVLNLSAGIETLISNPSWRPRVRIHWTISIAGAVLCLIAMLMIAPGYALFSLISVSLIYIAMKKRKFKSSWLDIHQGILLYFSRSIIYRLKLGKSAAKSWRPHFLVFTKFSEEHSIPLMKFSESISQNKGFLTMASFVPNGMLTVQKQKKMQKEMADRFKNFNIECFVRVNEANTIIDGMRHMINYYGLGPLAPNTILFGGIKKEEESVEFIEVMKAAILRHYNIVIMNDNNKTIELKKSANNEIHVWWDDSHPDNSDLMLVFAYMLQRKQKRKNERIFVKAIVADEIQKKRKYEQFQTLSIEKRLPIEVEVYISPCDIQSRLQLINAFSKDAEMVMMSLNPPPTQEENIDDYITYLHLLSQNMKTLPSLILTLSSEHTPLDIILR